MRAIGFTWQYLLLGALSLSIGWGVRGQFGHEYGAAMAGALGALAIVLLAGREDWRRRVAYFTMFSAIGWGIGGSMSYMKVVGYTHSPDAATALYGFANMFVLGFLWSAPGGAGAALPAYLSREKLTGFFIPISAVFGAWLARDIAADFVPILHFDGVGFTVPILAVLIVVLVRRRFDMCSSLVLHLCIGWWVGMILLVRFCGLHMSPPRADGWAGCVGLVAGLLFFCWRNKLGGVAFVTLCTGFLGGIGFCFAAAVKGALIATGLQTNWHSVMEQSDGFFHGLALAIAMGFLFRRAPRITDDPPVRRWTDVYAVTFILWLLTFLNFRLSPNEWVEEIQTLTPQLYGIWVEAMFRPSRGFIGWLDFAYLAIGVAMVWTLVLHLRRPVPLVPSTWLGKGQLMYLVFLWSQIAINFALVLPRFAPQRLVTEWFMTLNAAFCTVLMITGAFAQPRREPASETDGSYAPWIRRTVAAGLVGAVAITFLSWGIKLACWDGSAVPMSAVHIRFGPNNTNNQK